MRKNVYQAYKPADRGMKRFLVTTADERTWAQEQPVLFLGQWCKIYNRRQIWERMDAQTAPYHWDDRKKLQKDYLYLQELYEELLRELAEKLNALHGTNLSLRYWRILIGPWLCVFMEILFDRWEMIRCVAADYQIAGARILNTDKDQMVPNDMADFSRFYSEDSWNEAIYGTLLKEWTAVPIEEEQPDEQRASSRASTAPEPDQWLKRKLMHVALVISQMFTREDELFLISSYLPTLQDIRLQRHLGQFPKHWRRIPAPQIQIDWAKRHWQVGRPGAEGFPGIVRAMIPRHIPTLYLEGYDALQKLCSGLPWPKKPRLIFTCNSFYSDDVFKAWAADKVEKGAPFVIGQHGGIYGTGLWESLEDHQYAVSDYWLSWGWGDEYRPRIKPVCNFKMAGRNMEWNSEGDALLVEMTIPRYSYRMCSMPVAGQWLGYFEDQCSFVDSLPESIRRKLVVRLQQQDYGWNQIDRWKCRYPDIHLDHGQASIMHLIERSRICISTHNATTFLESLSMNIPTIVFWDPNHYELRENAVSYFDLLEKAGIFHVTPESAAKHIALVWDDVAAWWKSEPVQAARKEFCYRYSRMPQRPLRDIEQVLRRISKDVTV